MKLLAAGSLLIFSAFPCLASVWVQTGQTTAQTQIDFDHSSSWSFRPIQEFVFSGGRFTMKDGSQTSADISLSVYEVTGSTTTLLAQVRQTNAMFCAGTSNCQNFSLHTFALGSASVAMQIGRNYVVALTSSAAPNKQSEAYFIKGPNQATFTDGNGNPYNPQPGVWTPEPGTMGLLALSSGLLCFRRLRAVK